MEALKTQDNKAIDLSDCFQSFSSPEELGEDELWWVWSIPCTFSHCHFGGLLHVYTLSIVIIMYNILYCILYMSKFVVHVPHISRT